MEAVERRSWRFAEATRYMPKLGAPRHAIDKRGTGNACPVRWLRNCYHLGDQPSACSGWTAERSSNGPALWRSSYDDLNGICVVTTALTVGRTEQQAVADFLAVAAELSVEFDRVLRFVQFGWGTGLSRLGPANWRQFGHETLRAPRKADAVCGCLSSGRAFFNCIALLHDRRSLQRESSCGHHLQLNLPLFLPLPFPYHAFSVLPYYLLTSS